MGQLTLVDQDDICISNTNRQLHALTSSVGYMKAEILRDRVLDINPSACVRVLLDFITSDNIVSKLFPDNETRYDFVVEAVDGVADKVSDANCNVFDISYNLLFKFRLP